MSDGETVPAPPQHGGSVTEGSGASLHELVDKTLVMLALVLVAFNVAGWMKKREFRYFGETAMYITLGLSTSIVFRVLYALVGEEAHVLKNVQLSTNFFYMVLLPPIIFEGGYSVHRMLFFKTIPTILGLAFAGGLFSTVVIAIIMYAATSIMATPLSLLESLIFGALISSTDPVSILAMLPKSTDRTLYITIFGESALNDAVAIILYRFFCGLAAAEGEGKVTVGLFILSIIESGWVFFGSFLVGSGVAFLYAKLTKHQKFSHDAETVEVAMLLVFAYLSYLLAEVLSLTGIISVFFTGVAMAHYAKPNLSSLSLLVAKHTLRIFSAVSDCFIFMYLGMGLLAFPKATYDPYIIFAGLVAVALGRTHVFFVCGAQNAAARAAPRAKIPKIPSQHQIFLWFSGLRGAVAFALAVQLLDNQHLSEYARSVIFGTAVIIVVTTVYGLSVITPMLIDRLDISAPAKPSATGAHGKVGSGASGGQDAHSGDDSDSDQDEAPLDDAQIADSFFGQLYKIDRDTLRPFLTNMRSGPRGRTPMHAHGMHPHVASPAPGGAASTVAVLPHMHHVGAGTSGGGYSKVRDGIALDDLTDGEDVQLGAAAGSVIGKDKTKDAAANAVPEPTVATVKVADDDDSIRARPNMGD